MNAQAILQKIEDDALKAAKQMQSDAEAKAAELRKASEERIEKARKETVTQADTECEALSGRMIRMSELETRKQLLAKKREVMDEAFDAAKTELQKLPPKNARAFLLGQLAASARGNEALIVGANGSGWFDSAFVGELNKALVKAGKQGAVTLAEERRAGVTGAVLSQSGTEVYCTFEAMLESMRTGAEADIARILFNE